MGRKERAGGPGVFQRFCSIEFRRAWAHGASRPQRLTCALPALGQQLAVILGVAVGAADPRELGHHEPHCRTFGRG